jgi:hypothetical protein
MKNGDSSACLACIVYNLEVNSSDDNKRLVMKKNNAENQLLINWFIYLGTPML